MFPFLKGGALQLVFMFVVMASVVTLQAQITTKLTQGNGGNIVYTKVDNLQKISAADDGPGGLCNMSDPCNASAGGCRSWEKCVNGVCNDTTNGGSRPASSDSCGGGGGGSQNPTNTPFPTRAANCGCSQPNEHCTMCDTGSNVCIGRCEDADGGGVSTPTPTTGGGSNACRTLTIEGTLWEADCSKSCSSNANCPKRTSGDTNPDTSNWCYMFSNGSYCLMRNQSGGGGGGTGATATPPPGATPTSGATVAGGCFTLGADVNRSQENGQYKFDVSVKFISLGGDGDVKLDRDGRHVAGWNGWNKNVKPVFTYGPEWTGGTITNSGNVNYVGTVANSAACPNVQSSMSCSFNVNDGSCSCGGASCSSTTPATPTPTIAGVNPTATPRVTITSAIVPPTATPTPRCEGSWQRCPNSVVCRPSIADCEGVPTSTPTAAQTPTMTPAQVATATPVTGPQRTAGEGDTTVVLTVDGSQTEVLTALSEVVPNFSSANMVFRVANVAGQSSVELTPSACTRSGNVFTFRFANTSSLQLSQPRSLTYTRSTGVVRVSLAE